MFFLNSLIKINSIILTLFIAAAAAVSYFIPAKNLPAMNRHDGVAMPVIMYHCVLKDTNRAGKYIVTPSEVENDIKYFKSLGYRSVSMAEVINYVENNAELPEKPIMLTFDDGFYNNYGYIVPLLEQYDEHAVFCIVGEYTDKYSEEDIVDLNYSYLRWKDIQELSLNPHVEIASHSYAFHSNTGARNGSKKKKYEDSSEYKRIFREDTEKLQNEFLENDLEPPYIYAYPFGAYSEESFDILENLGFKATFSCNEGMNYLTHDSKCLYLLKRYNRPSGMASADFIKVTSKNS